MANTQQNEVTCDSSQTGDAVVHGVMLSVLCAISYSLVTRMLAHVFSASRDDDLLLFAFHPWGMAALIGARAVAMSLLGRPDDMITTGITTAVVMVVAAISPDHAWKQPILREVDTIAGAAVGVSGSWIGLRSARGLAHLRKSTYERHA